MEEIWKDVIEFEGLYQVSDLGRIKSISRVVLCKNNTLKTIPERILKLCKYPKSKDPNDYYLGVTLCKQGKEKSCRVHILVAESFIPNPNNLNEVNHLDRIKHNNVVTNLEWSDGREQTSHRFLTSKKTSKYTGVSWHSTNQKWVAQIQISNKKKTLGYFLNEEDARDAYLSALVENGLQNKYAIFE